MSLSHARTHIHTHSQSTMSESFTIRCSFPSFLGNILLRATLFLLFGQHLFASGVQGSLLLTRLLQPRRLIRVHAGATLEAFVVCDRLLSFHFFCRSKPCFCQ